MQMETSLTQLILSAVQAQLANSDTYRIADIVTWINNNGGVNGRRITRRDVIRHIASIIESRDRQSE